MGKRIQILICMGILTGILFACAGDDDRKKLESASGSGISGQAVTSGYAAGEAVSNRGIHENAASAAAISTGKKKKYRFCNKYCLYYSEEGSFCIIEHRLSDGSERKIKIGDHIVICYVDDDWVYYLESRDYYDFRSDLYRAPVEKKKLNIEKAECIFTERSGIYDEDVYCDGRYLVYITSDVMNSHYRKYDLQEQKYVGEQKEDDDAATLYGAAGRAVFYSGYEGVMRQDLDSEELIKITDGYFGSTNEDDGQIAMTDSDVFYAEDSVFDKETYRQQHMDEDDAPPIEIGQYHMADNSNKKIITHNQMRRLLIQEGFIDAAHEENYEYYPQKLLVSGKRLYVQMDISWKEKKVIHQNKAVFSYKIGKKEKLCYEKGLTGCLANPKKDQKVFEKIYDDEEDEGVDALFLSRGGCLYMTEGKCFMYLYDSGKGKNRVACYDLVSGKFKFLTKKDSDWYLPYYNGVQPYWEAFVDGIEADMPNNKPVDWPYW